MAKKAKGDADQDGEGKSIVEIARGLAEILTEHHLSELIVEAEATTVTLRRETNVQQFAAPSPMPAPAHFVPHHISHAITPAPTAPVAVVDDKAHVVSSPFVGTFYRKPNPDSPNYVSMGDKVDKGSVLCIVEAMKLMNEIEADVAGTIVGILVEDGAPVEYGQPLFKIG
ncbi:MAG: acetyl-CoA carboxylase biotin carboxyl carrier protein [Myxococcales bacterium]|nr:acetyl-CoA carboxylase biotin carboxyl carrier protein [Myxococcales bacterium]